MIKMIKMGALCPRRRIRLVLRICRGRHVLLGGTRFGEAESFAGQQGWTRCRGALVIDQIAHAALRLRLAFSMLRTLRFA